MRIRSLALRDYSPIKHFHIDGLGSTVIIAGANGSGKTRLKDALVRTFQGNPEMDLIIEATRPEEAEKYFGAQEISVKKGVKNQTLQDYINSRKYGLGRYVGSLVQIDSGRSVQSVKFNPVNWLGGDPDDANSAGTFYFNPFANRWQDFMNYIHQKAAARDKKLAEEMKADPTKVGQAIIDSHPDPLEKYQRIFSDILPGKTLLAIDPASPNEFRYRDEFGQELNFRSLSSGEQEVIKVLFDVARKDIRHSIIVIDEPELHLHPTLAFKLVESLKSIGEHTNQFIFLTHSSDLISTYYSTGDVYFIDMRQTGVNQAHRLSDLAADHSELVTLIGQNLGLFAVGKKLVFVEGEESSIDRLTYQKIAQEIDSEIKVIPAGSVLNVMALGNIERQIRKAIFGIELYMVRDRDGLSDEQVNNLEASQRIRCLKRRHIENYFLDEEVLYEVAKRLYLTRSNSELSSDIIKGEIERTAKESIGYNLYKNVKEILKLNWFLKAPALSGIDMQDVALVRMKLNEAIRESLAELNASLQPDDVETWIAKEEAGLNAQLKSGSWIETFHGKQIFSRVCADVLKADRLQIRHAYVDTALQVKPVTLADIRNLFNNM